jgi:hypothetical protein
MNKIIDSWILLSFKLLGFVLYQLTCCFILHLPWFVFFSIIEFLFSFMKLIIQKKIVPAQ